MYADVEETGDWKEAVLQNASPIKCVQICRIHFPAQQDDGAEDETAQAAQCGPLVGSLEAFQTGVHFRIPRANERHVCEQGEQSAHKPETNTQNCQYQKTSRCDDFDEKTLGADFVIRLLLKRTNQIYDQLHAGQKFASREEQPPFKGQQQNHHCGGVDAECLGDEVKIQHDTLPSFCHGRSPSGDIEIATQNSSSVTFVNKVKHQCAQDNRDYAVDDAKD
ncbi:hypothetical protein T07_3214 [Trichinella nelsoni]|uniref:Uncharacterized protein n=1 Tax=Trichinella nelsoni TaxID=6336 RepID=A0A0V0S715_9BILA|nr:hypothetical protein T07_3214 [Trichinella nelsoni]